TNFQRPTRAAPCCALIWDSAAAADQGIHLRPGVTCADDNQRVRRPGFLQEPSYSIQTWRARTVSRRARPDGACWAWRVARAALLFGPIREDKSADLF